MRGVVALCAVVNLVMIPYDLVVIDQPPTAVFNLLVAAYCAWSALS